jgi:hypothetical protein
MARFSGSSHKPAAQAARDFYGLAMRVGDIRTAGSKTW